MTVFSFRSMPQMRWVGVGLSISRVVEMRAWRRLRPVCLRLYVLRPQRGLRRVQARAGSAACCPASRHQETAGDRGSIFPHRDSSPQSSRASRLVFGGVECACGVNKIASRHQRRPKVCDNLLLTLRTLVYQRQAPLLGGAWVFAHHPLACTWHIGRNEYPLEKFFESAVACCVAAAHHGIGRPPFDDVFAQDFSPAVIKFVGYDHQTSLREG